MPKNEETLTQFDAMDIWRCPQLGGPVTFDYCRRMNGGLPCRKLHACWRQKLDVEQFLAEHYTDEEMQTAFHQPPQGRMDTIFDVLNKVAKNKS